MKKTLTLPAGLIFCVISGFLWSLTHTGRALSPNIAGFQEYPASFDYSTPNNVDYEFEGTEVLFPVAVIDSGVDYNHRDIGPRMHKNTDTTPVEIEGYFVTDDHFGWDFNESDNRAYDSGYVHSPELETVPGYDQEATFQENLSEIGGALVRNTLQVVKALIYAGTPGHGTHVSGIILKKCAECSVVPVKVFGSEDRTIQSVLAAIQYVDLRGYRLVNMSLGADLDLMETDSENYRHSLELIDAIASRPHILFVVAAGNHSKYLSRDKARIYPAMINLPNVITVGAVDDNGLLAEFSNYDPQIVDVFAPGVNIQSTWNDGGYRTVSGTSMSCPFVTGLIGSDWAQNPQLSVPQVRARFFTAVSWGTIQFKSLTPAVVPMVQ